MIPPAILPELYNRGAVERYARSALPGAPVQPHVPRRHPARRTAALVVRGVRGARVARLGRRSASAPAADCP